MQKYCLICGKEFRVTPSRIRIKTCGNNDCKVKIKILANRRITEKLKKRIVVKCKYCGSEYWVHKSREFKTKYCSLSCKAKAEKPRYIDGRTYYQRHRKEKCEICGSKRLLAVHHIDKNRKNSNPNNLITLCCVCHRRKHPEGQFKKGHIYHKNN